MKRILYLFTCNYCGKQITVETTDKRLTPDGWATVVNSDDRSDGKEFHFDTHKCYKKYDKKHPDTIDCNASLYAAQEWFK